MTRISKSAAGVLAGMCLGAAILLPFHFNLFATESGLAPSFNVDSAPIVRDTKGVTSWAPVVKKAAPSVVSIYSTRTVKVRNPFQNDPLFRQFFGDQLPDTHKEQDLGSGVIISSDGYILTANHVVNGADEIKVAFGGDNGKEFDAKIIGTDPRTDVAVLKIDATGLPAVALGDSSQLEIGDVVLAIGNPFNIGQTVTMGIISALGRHGYGINGPMGYEDFIQTDAAINPGNSGGALVDAEGRLIGINTWIASSSGGSEGVGFAVPVNLARRVMESLITSGKVSRGYLGVSINDLTPDLARAFDFQNSGGALIGDVFEGTPAAKAGIKSGDIITEINGKPVADANNLTLAVSQMTPGTEATVKVFRQGATKTFTVKLGELPSETAQNDNGKNTTDSSTTDALDGVTVDDLDSQARDELKIPSDIKGALVTDVSEDSNAADAGLQKNDVIVEIDRQPVAGADAAVKLAGAAKGNQILLKIWRRESDDFASTTYLTVDNTKRDKDK